MTTASDSGQSDNSYFNDPESGAEMARLTDQDRLLTKGMGGLFPEQSDLSPIHRILDIGCGPGGWALDVAYAYPEKEVVGFDISQQMIDYAQARARVQGLDNASFRVMDATKPLNFPDEYFDLVNARTIGFFPTTVWPNLMRECMRILRSEGIIRLTESEWGFTNGPATEKLQGMFYRALKAGGRSFTFDGRRHGITTMLAGFLRDAGFIDIQQKAHVIDFSTGTEAHAGFYKDWQVVYKLSQPFFINMGVTTQEEVEPAYEQMLVEMMQDDFRGIMYLLTAWGTKP
jgi:ubiquinone/menaquinone biosynthesis C-methylase UbiE